MAADKSKKVPYSIVENSDGSYAVVENPESGTWGNLAFHGHKVVRSPFRTLTEARERVKEIGKVFEYVPFEVKK